MIDGPVALSEPASASATATATAEYTRIFEEQQPRLVAYARSLTRNSWTAEDLVAEAHFRVWRRLSAGHEIDNVPAYLMTTLRHLAAAAGSATRETPQDPQDPQSPERVQIGTHDGDPAERVSSVDLLVRVLGQLPERWVQALWLAEAEGQPLEAVGQRIGAKQGATAVLLHRAREGMRQAFLRAHPGAPDDPACEAHWERMPAYVRGTATSRQSEQVLGHVDGCDDCRGRLVELMRANDRLPALVGPALLVFAVGGAGKFLLTFTAGSAGAVTAAGAAGAAGGHGGGLLDTARQAVTGGGAAKPTAVAVGAAVASAAIAAVIALGAFDASPLRPEGSQLAKVPVMQPSQGPGVHVPEERTSGGAAETREDERASTNGEVVSAAGPAVVEVVPAVADESTPTVAGPVAERPVDDSRRPVVEAPVAEKPVGGPVEEEPAEEKPAEEKPAGPGYEVPEPEAPEEEAPEAEKPETETPEVEVPEEEAPEPEVPETETPEVEVPEPEVPEVEVPEPEVPETEDPETEDPGSEPPAPVDPAPAPPNPSDPGDGCDG
ncbi:hypothetical protein GCM10023083_26790 [Streptomyces phyllanthi]|uniref:sigma-70 family RNA polymerase sigma factor n=1 Tax=Streptomyces phyllanthi TaxID=1803180 RepID=UPI0031E855EA